LRAGSPRSREEARSKEREAGNKEEGRLESPLDPDRDGLATTATRLIWRRRRRALGLARLARKAEIPWGAGETFPCETKGSELEIGKYVI